MLGLGAAVCGVFSGSIASQQRNEAKINILLGWELVCLHMLHITSIPEEKCADSAVALLGDRVCLVKAM